MCRRFTPIWSPKRSKAAWISCIKPQGLVVAKSNWRWKMASWNPFILSVGVMGTCKAFPNWWRGCVRQMWLPDWKAYVVEWSPLRVPTSWRRLWSRLCHTPDKDDGRRIFSQLHTKKNFAGFMRVQNLHFYFMALFKSADKKTDCTYLRMPVLQSVFLYSFKNGKRHICISGTVLNLSHGCFGR